MMTPLRDRSETRWLKSQSTVRNRTSISFLWGNYAGEAKGKPEVAACVQTQRERCLPRLRPSCRGEDSRGLLLQSKSGPCHGHTSTRGE